MLIFLFISGMYMQEFNVITGRFAPSPSGRMHLGNIFTAVLSWLSVRSRGGKWVLRIEDLDPLRSKRHYSDLIEEDLTWLGLDWDEGGQEGKGSNGPYCQSRRGGFYEKALEHLAALDLIYPCYCTRSELMATNAPHLSDGRRVYGGMCRPVRFGGRCADKPDNRQPRAIRLYVPAEKTVAFSDGVFGDIEVNLGCEVGDFVVRRGDGAWAYQLAVVVDDAMMSVTEVMRGCDLLQSAAQQIYIYGLLGRRPPRYVHLPLLCNTHGQRLSKRDGSLSMEALRKDYSVEDILGRIGYISGLLAEPCRATLRQLLEVYDERKIPCVKQIIV